MIGKKLGHYRIVARIGAGGMGEVYRARDERLQRDVAVKILQEKAGADAGSGKRLLREARAASALNDPHICTIHEVGEADGLTFLVMELVSGRPLDSLIPAKGLRYDQVIQYGIQISAALLHAHEQGVVHRDIKPSNIVITDSGQIKMLDFGLAARRRVAEAEQATRSAESLSTEGKIAGTLPYMAPEVLRGEEADPGADVWALGVLLYEMSTGGLPFKGQTAYEISAAILSAPPLALPAHVPAGLTVVIKRCLEKETGRRYQQMSEIHAALEALHSEARFSSPAAQLPANSSAAARRHRIIWWGIGPAAVTVIAATLFVARPLRNRYFPPAGEGRIQSLAVLPLENLSRDPDQQYFADGMTEELTTQLAQVGALRVISHGSAARFRGSTRPLSEIAKDLNVDAVIEGSVEQSGQRVRVTAQLIDARLDRHLWAKSYDGDLRDVLSLQGRLAESIVQEIEVKLTPQEQSRLSSSHPIDSAAYQLYLRGRYFSDRPRKETLEKAVDYYQQAINLDPNYAPAWAWLGDSYMYQAALGFIPETVGWPKGRDALNHAITLDPHLADAYASLGALQASHDWDWQGARKSFATALSLQPNNAAALRNQATLQAALGDTEAALISARRVVALDPVGTLSNGLLADRAYSAGQLDESIAANRRCLELDPASEGVHVQLALIELARGHAAQALAEAQKEPEPVFRLQALVLSYHALGRQREYESSLQELLAKARLGGPYQIAQVYGYLGDAHLTFEWLDRAYALHDSGLTFVNCDPAFARFKHDPRFAAVLRKMRLST